MSFFPVDDIWLPKVSTKTYFDDSEISSLRKKSSSFDFFRLFTATCFFVVFSLSAFFLSVLLHFTADTKLQLALQKIYSNFHKADSLKYAIVILTSTLSIRFCFEPLGKKLHQKFRSQVPWERSIEFILFNELYGPMEVMFLMALFSTIIEYFLPHLVNLPKALLPNFVQGTMFLTFVVVSARVLYKVRTKITNESSLKSSVESRGHLTQRRRLEAIDKLLAVSTTICVIIMTTRLLGLEVNSVIAIGGLGGVAVGLAGREIVENFFTGLVIIFSGPFDVGDEVEFRGPSGQDLLLMLVGIELLLGALKGKCFNVPNTLVSKTVVLNITRKNNEWRVYEHLGIRVDDVHKVQMIVSDMRRMLRKDLRVIKHLHRRFFLEKISKDQVTLYLSCYVEARNRDAYMDVKQDILLKFVNIVHHNGAELAQNKLVVDWNPYLWQSDRQVDKNQQLNKMIFHNQQL